MFLMLAFFLATCSLVYELAFAKVISELTGNAMVWESVSMASFLLGIGLQNLFGKNAVPSWCQLARNELLLSAVAVIGWYLVHYLQMNYRAYVYDLGQLRDMWTLPPVFLLGILSQPVILVVGWFSGYELSFFLAPSSVRDMRFREAKILAAYHFGALAGTLAVIACMRQAVPPITMITAAAFANAAMAGVLFVVGGERSRLLNTCVTLAFLCWSWIFSGVFEQGFLKHHYYNQFRWRSDESGLRDVSFPDDPLVFLKKVGQWPDVIRYRSPFQVIDFVTDIDHPSDVFADPPIAMYINGRFQISRRSSSEYHEYMTHVALAHSDVQPRRIAVLGGGDGALVHELLKYQDAVIDVIEIDPVILSLARTFPPLTELNQYALSNSRVRVYQADALRFMREARETYDAIFMDLTYPFEFDSAKFYSAEYLGLLRKRLSPSGILVAGIPMNLVFAARPELGELVLRTMAKAGFQNALAYNFASHHFVAATPGALKEQPQIPDDLEFLSLVPNRLPAIDRRSISLHNAVVPMQSYFSLQFPGALMSNDPFF